MPVEFAAELTGINERRIRSHLAHDGTLPNSDDMLAYIRLLGPDFLNLWTQAVGITGAHRPKSVDGCRFKSTLHAQTVASCLMLKLSEAVEDGRIDHIETVEIPKTIFETTAYLNAMAANYGELRA